MTYLAIIIGAVLFCFLIVKLAKYAANLNMALVALAIIGMLMTPINLMLGIQIAAWSVAIMFLFWILFALSGLITMVVVTPILLLLGAIGLLKN